MPHRAHGTSAGGGAAPHGSQVSHRSRPGPDGGRIRRGTRARQGDDVLDLHLRPVACRTGRSSADGWSVPPHAGYSPRAPAGEASRGTTFRMDVRLDVVALMASTLPPYLRGRAARGGEGI